MQIRVAKQVLARSFARFGLRSPQNLLKQFWFPRLSGHFSGVPIARVVCLYLCTYWHLLFVENLKSQASGAEGVPQKFAKAWLKTEVAISTLNSPFDPLKDTIILRVPWEPSICRGGHWRQGPIQHRHHVSDEIVSLPAGERGGAWDSWGLGLGFRWS